MRSLAQRRYLALDAVLVDLLRGSLVFSLFHLEDVRLYVLDLLLDLVSLRHQGLDLLAEFLDESNLRMSVCEGKIPNKNIFASDRYIFREDGEVPLYCVLEFRVQAKIEISALYFFLVFPLHPSFSRNLVLARRAAARRSA